MRHAVLYRDEEAYSPWPVLWRLPDGSIGAGVVTSPVGSHPGASVFGRFLAFVSRDRGGSWEASGDPAHPANWPATTADERMDRFALILPDGTFVAVGARGFEAWEASRLEEARSLGRWIREIPERPEWIAVQSPSSAASAPLTGGGPGSGASGRLPASGGCGASTAAR